MAGKTLIFVVFSKMVTNDSFLAITQKEVIVI